MLCDKCGKRISTRGIKIQEKEEGEYKVTFFSCFHCGARYQITTTDTRQRELIEERKKLAKKMFLARKKNFRAKTFSEYQKKEKEIERTMERRAKSLRAIGEKILHPEEVEGHGQENSQGGAEGVQAH